jgi:thioredoxin-related protein
MHRNLLFALLLFSFGWADHLHWLGDYDKALEQAKREHKPLLVFVVQKKSPLCHKVIQKVFTNQPYIQVLNTKAVTVMVTYADVVHYPVELYWTNTYPTLFFVESGKELFLREPLYGEEINATVLLKIVDRL